MVSFSPRDDTPFANEAFKGELADPLLGQLDAAGFRLTAPRRAIARLIRARQGTFTAAELLDDARARGLPIGRATVFRALDLLTELRLLERLSMPSGEQAYVPCEAAHHHHVVCSSCGRSTDIGDPSLVATLAEIERATGYAIDRHRLELYGRCPRCRAMEPGPA